MATKKSFQELVSTDVEQELDVFPEKVNVPFPVLAPGETTITRGLSTHDFAVAALESLDWNAIGMSQDEAARLCWSMAEAMVRNKP